MDMELINFFFGDIIHFVGLLLFTDLVFWNVRKIFKKE